MIIGNLTNMNLRKKILVGLGIMIIGLVIISAFMSIDFENKRKDSWEFFTTENSELISDSAGEVVIDNNGKIWIGTSKVVNVISGDSWQNYTLPDNIHGMAVDPGGRIWVVLGEEIYIFDSENLSSPSRILFDNDILYGRFPIAFDLSGNAWIGTRNGVKIFDGTNWTTLNVNNSGITSDSINAIAFNESGNAWIGTGKGISILDGEDWISYNTTNSSIPGNFIQTIVFDHLGRTWTGTMQNGVGVFDGEDWKTKNTEVFGTDYVHDVHEITIDSDENIYILHNFLTIFNGTEWTRYDIWNSGLDNASSNDIAVDQEGRIWITSYKGVNVAALEVQGLPNKVSEEELSDYSESFFNWKYILLPIIFLVLIWLAIFLEDLVIFFLGIGTGIIWILRYFGIWITDEFLSIIVTITIIIGVIGGLIGSAIRKINKKDKKTSIKPTIKGLIIGTVIGFIVGILLVMIAFSMG